MFKNIILASLVALVLIVGASQPVSALTADEVQAQIRELLSKVADLTKQLNALRGQGVLNSFTNPSTNVSSPAMPSIAHRLCALGIRSFREGQEGDDVKAFQEFLQSEGFLSVAPTGFYGPLTRDALARWQGAQGFERAGVIGPKTLERIRFKCGFGGGAPGSFTALPTRGTAPLEVVFKSMVGGFRPASTYWMIDFGDGKSERAAECAAPADACTEPGTNTHVYTADGTYTATLSKITDPCPDDGDPSTPRCLAAVQSEVVGKVQVFVGTAPGSCTKEYKPVCGAKPIVCITTPCNPIPTTYGNRCMMNSDGASFLYEGSCRATTPNPADDAQCKSWYDGCNSCSRSSAGGAAACTLKYCAIPEKAYCTGYFTDKNRAPTVSGLVGPTTLAVGASGTWIITASDPENGPLSYSVNWGEATPYLNSAAAAPTAAFQQTTSFSHSYATAGVYTVTVLVTDSAGLAAKAMTTVKVGDTPVACTMEYAPVCGRPAGCANTCAPGMACPAICQLQTPQTYGNKCTLTGAGAQFLHTGECTSTSGSIY